MGRTHLAADQTLAQAVTQVHQQWQSQGDSTKSTPPKRRRPAPPPKPAPATSSDSLAHQLHTLLTESQSQHNTYQQLAQQLLTLLTPLNSILDQALHHHTVRSFYSHHLRPTPTTDGVDLAKIRQTALSHTWSHTSGLNLGHSAEILQAIREGKPLPKANIIEVWSLTEAEALRTAWRAHGLTTSLTLLLQGPAKKHTYTRIRVMRGR